MKHGVKEVGIFVVTLLCPARDSMLTRLWDINGYFIRRLWDN